MNRRHETVAHSEAALNAGVNYEDPHEGHKKMYDNVQDLMKERDQPIHRAQGEHRGARIDEELKEEEQAEIAKKQDSKAHHGQHSKDHHH